MSLLSAVLAFLQNCPHLLQCAKHLQEGCNLGTAKGRAIMWGLTAYHKVSTRLQAGSCWHVRGVAPTCLLRSRRARWVVGMCVE
jgi:hypothetical protein